MTGGDEDAWLIALGAEVSDGRRVDWDAAERRASDSDARRVVTELRRLADVLGARGGAPRWQTTTPPTIPAHRAFLPRGATS